MSAMITAEVVGSAIVDAAATEVIGSIAVDAVAGGMLEAGAVDALAAGSLAGGGSAALVGGAGAGGLVGGASYLAPEVLSSDIAAGNIGVNALATSNAGAEGLAGFIDTPIGAATTGPGGTIAGGAIGADTAAIPASTASQFGLSGSQLLGSAASNLIGADLQANAARNAANQQSAAAAAAGQTQLAMYDKQIALQAPWMQAGQQALGQLTQGMMPGGQFNKPYTLADFQSGPQSGLYNFANAQAQEAMQNQLNAGGQQMSTNAVQGAGQLAGNIANQFYNTGFNQNLQTNQFALNALQGVAGEGQTATNASSTATGNLGSNLANLTVGAGNAQAAGTIGAGNAWGGALSSIGNTLSTPGAMSALSSLFA